MAAALSGVFNQTFPGGITYVFFRVVLSGSYSTGGETLDFATIAPNLAGIPVYCDIKSNVGNEYVYASGTTPATGKMKLLVEAAVGTNTPLVEHTAVAYVAGESGDTITGMAVFK